MDSRQWFHVPEAGSEKQRCASLPTVSADFSVPAFVLPRGSVTAELLTSRLWSSVICDSTNSIRRLSAVARACDPGTLGG